MLKFHIRKVSARKFWVHYGFNLLIGDRKKLISENCTWHAEQDDFNYMRCYLSADNLSGFCITDTGELVCVHSTTKGRGNYLVSCAVLLGASHLDCFDGYLPGLYARHGFIEVKREANWTPGQPDVVYMRR